MNVNKCTLFVVCFLFIVTAFAFTPEEARQVYGGLATPSTSVYTEAGDYLFMELKWKVDDQADSEAVDAMELSVMYKALEQYVIPVPNDNAINSPFCKELTTWLIPEQEFDFSNVSCTTLKEEEKDGEHCAVFAFELPVLQKAKKEAEQKVLQLQKRSDADWASALADAFVNFKTKDEKRQFFFMLNCPIVSFLDRNIGIEPKNLEGRTDLASKELSQLLEWKPEQGSIFYDNPALNWSSYVKSNATVFFPLWSEDDGGAFDKVKPLYSKGKDIPKIISLLVESISANPIGSIKWQYLGGVLKASNQYQDAVIAYMQAIRQNNNNTFAWKGLAESMKKAGMTENASGVTWYLRMIDTGK